MQPFIILLLATTLMMLSGGCDGQLMIWTRSVGEIGRYTRAYTMDTVAMTEDGSILVTSNSYDEYEGSGDKRTVVKTHYLLYKAESFEQQAQYIQQLHEQHPASAWMTTWYDGVMMLSFLWPDRADYTVIMTEETLPPSLRNTTPLELIPFEYEPHGEGLERARDHARRWKWPDDDPRIQELAERDDRERYEERTRWVKYRALYWHGEVTCWLKFNDCQHHRKLYTPGGVALQVLLIGPAVIGDVILYVPRGLLQGYAVGLAIP